MCVLKDVKNAKTVTKKKKKSKRKGLMERMEKQSKTLKKDMERLKFAKAETGESKMYPVSMSSSHAPSDASYIYSYSSASEEDAEEVKPKAKPDTSKIPKIISAAIGREALSKVGELQKKIMANKVELLDLSNTGRELMVLANLESDW